MRRGAAAQEKLFGVLVWASLLWLCCFFLGEGTGGRTRRPVFLQPQDYVLTGLGLILTSFASSVPPAQQVNQDLSRQLLQDGYHLDEVPDDEDLDLIPPKPIASSSCPCCFGGNFSCVIQ